MNDYQRLQPTGNKDSDELATSMWMNVRSLQRDLYWTITEAERLNKLLMADDYMLSEEFMTEYVLALLEKGVFSIDSQLLPKDTPFVEAVIVRLIAFNWKRNRIAAMKLTQLSDRSKEFMIGGEPVMDPLVIGIETIEHDIECFVSDGHDDGRNHNVKCT